VLSIDILLCCTTDGESMERDEEVADPTTRLEKRGEYPNRIPPPG